MKMMWLIENWFLCVALATLTCAAVMAAYRFLGMPSAKQAAAIKEWLLYACMEAEKELGSGTGQLKLRYVWDLFIARFPAAAKVVSFDMFSGWVDGALEEMRQLLSQNKAIREVVNKE